ncbi:MAG TPA: di-heme oxidoredictase family protein [Pyrinomonadaceae bacterium]|nr:di-heme oxidoredictase family protein [Pyrinomonadaceae bacterium]
MRLFKLSLVTAFAVAIALSTASRHGVSSQTTSEAPAAFDDQPVPGFFAGTTAQQQAEFDGVKAAFEEVDVIADGLGPVYNAQSCAECHQNPVTGGISQITEFRCGHLDAFGNFVDCPGGSLINDRAINARIQERRPTNAETVFTFRTSLNTLGDGFVEAISNTTLQNIAAAQPNQSGGQIAGQLIAVPVLEAGGATRFGRFGWKNQHASLLSFSSDAYLNEIGITNRFALAENTSLGNSVAAFDPVPDNQPCANIPNTICGEDTEDDISEFTEFMRATKAPPRDTFGLNVNDVAAGDNLFNAIGCAVCHVRNITTAAPGTAINGGAFTVPTALGNKVIHPFSDFLMHNVGTGDGIVQNGGQSTANKLRTAPLWGLRTRGRLMHDGETTNRTEAILRHAGEATGVINNFRSLSATQKAQLVTFLQSL